MNTYSSEILPFSNQEIPDSNLQNTIETVPSEHFLTTSERQKANPESILTFINKFFPDFKSEKEIQHIKKNYDSLLKQYAPDELQTVLIEIQYLSETVLEEYERKIFKGKSLNELLNSLF